MDSETVGFTLMRSHEKKTAGCLIKRGRGGVDFGTKMLCFSITFIFFDW
jgi:hypothetical protein